MQGRLFSREQNAPIGGNASRSGQSGQGLIEFALVIPMLLVLFMAILELVLALNASLAVNRASQHGAHVAAAAGNVLGADCLILDAVEQDIVVPNNPGNISEVLIERAGFTSDITDMRQRYLRGGATTCAFPDGSTISVPYTLTTATYPESQRCTVLGGCPSLSPARSTVDNISVSVVYRHDWVTPLNGTLDFVGRSGSSSSAFSGWQFEQRNIFRMEPTL